MALPLEVLADLELAVDGENVQIRGDGDRIVVDLPSLRAGRRLVTHGPLATGDRERRLRQVNEALRIAGITVDVRLGGDVIARIGEGARPSTVSRLLRLGDVEVRTGPSVKSAARERPLVTAGVVAGLVAFLAWLFFRRGDE
jgi:hypothetical protein